MCVHVHDNLALMLYVLYVLYVLHVLHVLCGVPVLSACAECLC
jgi:hypothetical protein